MCKPLKFQTEIIWSNIIHSLNYWTLGCKDIGFVKSEFMGNKSYKETHIYSLGVERRNFVTLKQNIKGKMINIAWEVTVSMNKCGILSIKEEDWKI